MEVHRDVLCCPRCSCDGRSSPIRREHRHFNGMELTVATDVVKQRPQYSCPHVTS